MKKFFLAILAVLATTIGAYAGDGTKVVEGSFKALKDATGTVYFAPIDFEGATWDNKAPLTTHYMNLNDLAKTGLTAMTAEFNSECKKLKAATSEADANYVVTIKVDNMDSYYNVMGFGLPGHITKIWGNLTIKDKAGNTVVVMNMKETDGGRNLDTNQSFVDAWDAVGNILAKHINKGK